MKKTSLIEMIREIIQEELSIDEASKAEEEELQNEAEKHVHRYKKIGKSMYKQKCSCGKERVWKQGGSHGKVLWYYPSEKKSRWSN